MNLINKLVSLAACALIYFGSNALSAATIHDVYDNYFSPHPPGYIAGTSTINDFDAASFLSAHTAIPNAITNGFFTDRPVIPGTSVTYTLLGSKLPTASITPFISGTVSFFNSNYDSWKPPFRNDSSPPIGAPVVSPYISHSYSLDNLLTSPYTLQVFQFIHSNEFDFYSFGLWNDSFSPYFSSWQFFEVNITDPGYEHVAAYFYSTWNGDFYDPQQLPEGQFWDLFLDMAIPIEQAAVPEPHVYLLMGSLLVAAYMLARRRVRA